MLPDGMSSTLASLSTLGVSDDLVDDLRSFLDKSAGELKERRPDAVGTGSFGSSPASVQCASDASKAREHVAKALNDMAVGLVGYGTVVVNLRRNVKHIDEATEVDLTRKVAQANACVAPSFSVPSQCALPGSSTDGDR
jgi:hypothetical protein